MKTKQRFRRNPVAFLATASILLTSPAHAESAPLQHPYLFLKGSNREAIRAKFNDPRFADYKSIILAEAEKLMTFNAGAPEDIGPKLRAFKLNARQKQPVLNILPWAWFLTGDAAYKDMFLAVMQNDFDQIEKGVLIFDPYKFVSEFTMVQFAVHAAAAYDLLYPELTLEQRESFEKYLDQSLALYQNKTKASYGWGNNIGAVYFASTAIVALSRLDGNPNARAILDECRIKLKEIFYKISIDPFEDGGYPEGPLYRNFAMLWTLALIDTYERVTGRTDHGLLDAPFFKNSFRYIESMLGGNGAWITFNDSQPQWYGAPGCAWLGARYDQPLMRWMADYLVKNHNSEPVNLRSRGLQPTYWVMAFLWRDDKPAPKEFPGLPTLSILLSLNTGVIRSEGTLKPGLLVGVRGRGPKEVGHAQSDVGSFVLYARGENFLIDPGYFHSEPVKHSLPIIDGVVAHEKNRDGAPLTGEEHGDLRSLSVDSSVVYKNRSVRRNFAMLGDKAVVVLDDIDGGEVMSLLQLGFGAQIQPDMKSVIVKGKNNSLFIGAYGPPLGLEMEGPIDFEKSWIYKRMADAGEISWNKLKGSYKADAGKPLVWVFVPMATGGPAPKVEVDHQPDLVTVRIGGEKPIKFSKTAGGWRPAT